MISKSKAARLTDRWGLPHQKKSHGGRGANQPCENVRRVVSPGPAPRGARRGPPLEIDDAGGILHLLHIAPLANQRGGVWRGETRVSRPTCSERDRLNCVRHIRVAQPNPRRTLKGEREDEVPKRLWEGPDRLRHRGGGRRMVPSSTENGPISTLFGTGKERSQRRRARSIFRDAIARKRRKRRSNTQGGPREGIGYLLRHSVRRMRKIRQGPDSADIGAVRHSG